MNKNKERAARISERVSPVVGDSMSAVIAAAAKDPDNLVFQVLLQRFTSTPKRYNFPKNEIERRLTLNAKICEQKKNDQ